MSGLLLVYGLIAKSGALLPMMKYLSAHKTMDLQVTMCLLLAGIGIAGALINSFKEPGNSIFDRFFLQPLGGEITLLTVIQETLEDASLVKYATEVEGRTFSKRLDTYISTLKQYNLDPALRIRRGQPSVIILETARQIDADIIILGPPRPTKGLSSIFGGSTTIQKIIKHTPSTVILAEPVSPASPPFFSHSDELTPALLAEIDLFFTETWVQHLNWFAETVHGLLDDSGPLGLYDESSCHFGAWLAKLPPSSRWDELASFVALPHRKFHQAIITMAEMAESKNLPEVIKLYHEEALPLSAALKEGLQKISIHLKSQSREASDSRLQ